MLINISLESPKSVEMTGPDNSDAGSMLTYECSSPVSSPQQSIRWEVTDKQYQEIEFQTGKKCFKFYNFVDCVTFQSLL